MTRGGEGGKKCPKVDDVICERPLIMSFNALRPHAFISLSIPAMYISHEIEKKRKYNSRVLNVEKAAFTPLVFSTTGGMGKKQYFSTRKQLKKSATQPTKATRT